MLLDFDEYTSIVDFFEPPVSEFTEEIALKILKKYKIYLGLIPEIQSHKHLDMFIPDETNQQYIDFLSSKIKECDSISHMRTLFFEFGIFFQMMIISGFPSDYPDIGKRFMEKYVLNLTFELIQTSYIEAYQTNMPFLSEYIQNLKKEPIFVS